MLYDFKWLGNTIFFSDSFRGILKIKTIFKSFPLSNYVFLMFNVF